MFARKHLKMELECEDYTNKSILVIGNKDLYGSIIKKLGGRWYSKLKNGRQGWLISKEKKPIIENLIDKSLEKIKEKSKSRQEQNRYHREESENDESEENNSVETKSDQDEFEKEKEKFKKEYNQLYKDIVVSPRKKDIMSTVDFYRNLAKSPEFKQENSDVYLSSDSDDEDDDSKNVEVLLRKIRNLETKYYDMEMRYRQLTKSF